MAAETTFRNNVKLIIIRRFAHAAKANIYAAYLRESGVECFISNSNTGTLIPFVEGGYPFLLHIAETDREEALELLNELDQKASTRIDEDYRDADFSDIEYEKALTDYEKRIDRGSGRYFVWALLLAALAIAFAFALNKGLKFQKEKQGIGCLNLSGHFNLPGPPWEGGNQIMQIKANY
jgi:hypothetical protein